MRAAYERYQPRTGVRRITRLVRLLLLAVIAAALLTVVLTSTLIASFRVGSESMLPTLAPGDRIFSSAIAYGGRVWWSGHRRFPGFGLPQRGDLVVIVPPYERPRPGWARFLGPFARFFTGGATGPELVVKRIVAIPGDTVRQIGQELFIRPESEGRFLRESELTPSETMPQEALPTGWDDTLPVIGRLDDLILQDAEYYVAGDNRSASADSRIWGPIEFSSILGRVTMRYWPLGRFGRP